LTRADPPRILKVDITDFEALGKVINDVNPSVIIHRCSQCAHSADISAAERNYSASENPDKREEVLRLNVQTPEFLGKLTREKGILLVYISTGLFIPICCS
jgi:dTDP-4-dehydrorhamnose reductase